MFATRLGVIVGPSRLAGAIRPLYTASVVRSPAGGFGLPPPRPPPKSRNDRSVGPPPAPIDQAQREPQKSRTKSRDAAGKPRGPAQPAQPAQSPQRKQPSSTSASSLLQAEASAIARRVRSPPPTQASSAPRTPSPPPPAAASAPKQSPSMAPTEAPRQRAPPPVFTARLPASAQHVPDEAPTERASRPQIELPPSPTAAASAATASSEPTRSTASFRPRSPPPSTSQSTRQSSPRQPGASSAIHRSTPPLSILGPAAPASAPGPKQGPPRITLFDRITQTETIPSTTWPWHPLPGKPGEPLKEERVIFERPNLDLTWTRTLGMIFFIGASVFLTGAVITMAFVPWLIDVWPQMQAAWTQSGSLSAIRAFNSNISGIGYISSVVTFIIPWFVVGMSQEAIAPCRHIGLVRRRINQNGKELWHYSMRLRLASLSTPVGIDREVPLRAENLAQWVTGRQRPDSVVLDLRFPGKTLLLRRAKIDHRYLDFKQAPELVKSDMDYVVSAQRLEWIFGPPVIGRTGDMRNAYIAFLLKIPRAIVSPLRFAYGLLPKRAREAIIRWWDRG